MNKFFNLIAAASILAISCGKPEQQGQQQRAVPVKTVKTTKSPTVFFDKYPGTVVALQKVDINSEVSGYLRDISFSEGSIVKKGQKLYTIDQSKYLSARNQAKANFMSAQATMQQAQKDADRYEALGEQDAIAKQQVDRSLTDLENAKQQVAAAKAALETAQTNLNYSTIEAPFTGMIGISQVRLGAFVSAGQTLLNTISSYDPMGVDFEINETEIRRYLDLEKSETILKDSVIFLTLPDNSKYKYPGKVSIIDRGVNSQTGTTTIRISFANPDQVLRDGMSAVVHVKNQSSGNNIIIPHKAVVEQMGEYFVYTVEEGKAKQIKIQTGKTIGSDIVINDGLKEGQEIIVEGIQSLRQGMPVQTGNAQQAGKAPSQKPAKETAK
ncbi:efflux RND transporter periplasmic adaptor subunit [Fulvivirga sediminis]|uniref:Efflux RND transporter periplasmic adaptor subunit n=1 Tax=Fulvivirga sediminis TaxID=2803949 RepID=A0A937K002_9BACT|nr:efflux RND transporter periplasmic adaptor subunit [Fulvivirga sediminis]MBL3657878.1 efflux RND transporter periplasmic adaptor subunit [Fulvivirga sediminis]